MTKHKAREAEEGEDFVTCRVSTATFVTAENKTSLAHADIIATTTSLVSSTNTLHRNNKLIEIATKIKNIQPLHLSVVPETFLWPSNSPLLT